MPAPSATGDTWFVNEAATTGTNDGTPWSNAFQGVSGVRNALSVAGAGDAVWVTHGTYLPTDSADRAVSLNPPGGVGLFGGFDGTEEAIGERDVVANLTLLSADLAGDDGPSFANREDNSFHVLRIENPGVQVNGFTIRGGMASDEPGLGGGGGIRVAPESDPLVKRCRIIENEADMGGGVWVERGGRFEDCEFSQNRAISLGISTGGGVHAAITLVGGQPTFTNCLFIGNAASRGGGIAGDHSEYELVNCTLVANRTTADTIGGGAFLEGTFGRATISNCALWANAGTAGSDAETAQVWTPSDPLFLTLNHCCIQSYAGVLPAEGAGNFATDPLFIDEFGADGVPGSGDEDLRLGIGSPLIDAGLNAAVPSNVTLDFDGLPRFVDDPATEDTGAGDPPVVDIGAFEFQVDAEPVPVPVATLSSTVAFVLVLLSIATAAFHRRQLASVSGDPR